MNNNNKKSFGKKGEELARNFLVKQGFAILESNFRYSKIGEIDIIAQKENLIIFVEVKSRHSDRFGGALYSISSKKKQSLKKTAQYYITHSNNNDITYRFDMISVREDSIEWIEDIIR